MILHPPFTITPRLLPGVTIAGATLALHLGPHPEIPRFGCFDGTHGREIRMTSEQAQGASHQGQCDQEVRALSEEPEIAAQLDSFTPDQLRESLAEYGAWSAEDLADHDQNRQRALWIAAGDIVENLPARATDYVGILDIGEESYEITSPLIGRKGDDPEACFQDLLRLLLDKPEDLPDDVAQWATANRAALIALEDQIATSENALIET
jgi:hypothetical protein